MPIGFDPNDPYGKPDWSFGMMKDPTSDKSQMERWEKNNQLNESPYEGMEQGLANGMQNLDPNASVHANLWQNQGLGDLWSQQAIAQQQSAYDLAKKYAGGADTAAYSQLQGSQGLGNAMARGGAMGAGGGARGSAAAQGAMQEQAGATSDMQRAAQAQQKAQDMQNYTSEAAKLGNQLYQSQLGYQQGNAAWQNSQGQLAGQYQQLGDTASLGASSMMENILAQNLGLATSANQNYLSQYEQSQNMQQQLFGAGASGIAAGAGQIGRSGFGGGGSSDNGPYGLGNNNENPWYNS